MSKLGIATISQEVDVDVDIEEILEDIDDDDLRAYLRNRAGDDDSLADELGEALRLIDADRPAAKILLDRFLRDRTGKHLIEVAPCL